MSANRHQPDPSPMNRCILVLCGTVRWLLFLIIGFTTTVQEATAQAAQAVERVGVDAYFRDSLRSGAQRVVTAGGAEYQVSGTQSLPQGAILSTRVGSAVDFQAPARGTDLRIVLLDRGFVRTAGGQGMLLIPVIVVEGNGLEYDVSRATFRGSIRVGVEDSLNRASSTPLPTPLAFFVSGEADTIAPQDLTVDHTNLPFTPIVLEEASPAEFVRILVRTTLHPDGVGVPIPIHRDSLRLSISPRAVQGFGLEDAAVSLGPAVDGAGVAVSLFSDRGHLAESNLTLRPGGTARTHIRSYGIGTATVLARSTAFPDAQSVVRFVFPWLFLASALLGGAIGGTAAWAIKKRGRGAEAEKPRLVLFLISGMLLGLIATVAYAVGINVTDLRPMVSTGQAVVFAMAALVAFGGSSALKFPPS